ITAREPYHWWNAAPPNEPWHFYTCYLEDATNVRAMAFHFEVKAPPGYGTREFYDRLDRGTPTEPMENVRGATRDRFRFQPVTGEYPFGYYAAVAAWMGMLDRFSGRLTVLFFGARIFSVLLLIASLVLVYAVARELRFTKKRSLLFTGIVAFFPLTTFVSSYVQPDNLSFTAGLCFLYLSLCFWREGG